ncbi:ATP-dependent DNA helicase Q4, partial [Modicella reniformis]
AGYRAVFMSPEIIFSGVPYGTMGQPIMERETAIVLDEAHCIGTWGNEFRRDYSHIGEHRGVVPPQVAFVSLSATFSKQLLDTVIRGLDFDINVSLFNKWFLRSRLFTSRLVPRLKQLDSTTGMGNKHDKDKTAYYHALLSTKCKLDIMEKFKSGMIRILLSTEAGMGCDISDFIRVVQIHVSKGSSNLLRFWSPQLWVQSTRSSCCRKVLNTVFGNEHQLLDNRCDYCNHEPELQSELEGKGDKANILGNKDSNTHNQGKCNCQRGDRKVDEARPNQ